MYLRNKILTTLSVIAISIAAAGPAGAAQLSDTMAKPGGFPERPLSMIVPYGPGGGSGQVSRAMIQGVTDATGMPVCRNRPFHDASSRALQYRKRCALASRRRLRNLVISRTPSHEA